MASSLFISAFLSLSLFSHLTSSGKTKVSIHGTQWFVNGKPTFSGKKAEGLLMNQRMVNGIFDDYNTSTQHNWDYPDTKRWDAERNTNEFIGNFSSYMSYGMNSFTVGLQGGCPYAYCHGPQTWYSTAFDPKTGDLDTRWFTRLLQVLRKADELGMVVIVQAFYPGQAVRFKTGTAIKNALTQLTEALMQTKLENFIVEVANECNFMPNTGGGILKPDGIIQSIQMVQKLSNHSLKVGTSFGGGHQPDDNVIAVSDFVLLHGNGRTSAEMEQKIQGIKNSNSYKTKNKPIVFNEDDHYDFTDANSHFEICLKNKVSWGLFIDCKQSPGDYKTGYQCPPTNWGVGATPLKKQYYEAVKSVTH